MAFEFRAKNRLQNALRIDFRHCFLDLTHFAKDPYIVTGCGGLAVDAGPTCRAFPIGHPSAFCSEPAPLLLQK
jgi:hypothetical protein